MSDSLPWAARYVYLDELWRRRPRLIFDPDLEAFLAGTEAGRDDSGVVELCDALVPRVEELPTWMVVRDSETAHRLSRSRPGAQFVPFEALTDVARQADWEVALIHLADGLVEFADGAEVVLSARGRAMVTQLGPRLEGSATRRSAVLTCGLERGPSYEALAEVCGDELGGARIFAIYRPQVVAVVEYGERVDDAKLLDQRNPSEGNEPDDLEVSLEERRDPDVRTESANPDEDSNDDLALSFDNTLGSQDPTIVELIAVAGSADRRGWQTRSLSLLELPSDGSSGPPAHAERIDAVYAREQSLRWQVTRLERELGLAIARPVETAEAEIASLRAQLAALRAATMSPAHIHVAPCEPNPLDHGATGRTDGVSARSIGGASGASRMQALAANASSVATTAVAAAMDGLMRRIERGGIGTLQLRRELMALRRRLRVSVGMAPRPPGSPPRG